MKSASFILIVLHLLIAGVTAQSSLAEAARELPSCAVSLHKVCDAVILSQILTNIDTFHLGDLPGHGHVGITLRPDRLTLHMLQCEAECRSSSLRSYQLFHQGGTK